MIFSDFTRTESGNKIFFKNSNPIENVGSLKFFKDDASGSFSKKEFRWSFDKNYWASWETLNQGNLTRIVTAGKKYLFFEIRYASSGSGAVNTFSINYLETSSATSTEDCNVPVPSPSPSPSPIPPEYGEDCNTGIETIVNAQTLCGKDCDYYLWRPNHKGQQPISTITDLQKILTNLSYGVQNSITNGDNVSGNGIGTFYEKTGQTLVFRRIDASDGIVISESDGIISLSVDASLAIKDPSINELFDLYYNLEQDLNDLSIYVDSKFLAIDISINDLYSKYWEIDVSINDLYSKIGDSSLNDLTNIGGGTGEVFKQITGGIGELRTIVAGNANVDVSTSGDQIIISLDASVSGAPIWSDPVPASADVGGVIGSGQGGTYAPIGNNSIEMLETILYEYFPPTINLNLDPSPGYYEKWDPAVLADVSIYGTFDNQPFLKVRVNDVSAYDTLIGGIGHIQYLPEVSSGSFTFNDGGFNSNWDDVVYSVKVYHNVNLTEMQPVEASAAINFVLPYIWGVVDNNVTIDNIDASTLEYFHSIGQKKIVPKQANEITFVTGSIFKAKFVYAYDATYGDLDSIFDVKNDFNVTTSFDSSIVNIDLGATPSPIPYKVYIKNHWIDVDSFKLIFNI